MISDEDPEQNDEETYKEDFIPNAESVVPEQNDQETYEDDFNPIAEPVVPEPGFSGAKIPPRRTGFGLGLFKDSDDSWLEELNAELYVRPLHSSSRAETSYGVRSLSDEQSESFEEETFSDNFHDSSQQNVSIEQEDLSYEAASGDKQQTAAAVELV